MSAELNPEKQKPVIGDFEKEIVNVCTELANILIEKNRKYGDSFRISRIDSEKRYGSRKVPFDFHSIEKIRRYISPEVDDEDSVLDLAGYSVLEVVCRRLDGC